MTTPMALRVVPRAALHRRFTIAAAVLAILLCACGGSAPPPTSGGSLQEAVVRNGDVTVRASAMQTAALSPAIAKQYGVPHDDRTVLLVIAVRQGPESQETSLAAKVTVKARDLLNREQTVAMRELRSGDLLDYVGTATVSPPDTLHFDVSVLGEGGARSTLQFNRDFHPR